MAKIIFFDYYKPDDNNGICAYRKLMLSHLSQQPQYETYAVYLRGPNQHKAVTKLENGIISIYLPNDLVINGHVSNSDIEFVKYLKHQINHTDGDEIIIHLNWMNHAYLAPLFRRELGAKIVLTKHCVSWRDNITTNYGLYRAIDSALDNKESRTAYLKRLLADEMTYFTLPDHVITVTDDAYFIVRNLYGMPDHKLTRIYNGIDFSAKAHVESKSDLRRKYGFADDDKILLFVGSLVAHKGLVNVFDTMLELKNRVDGVKLLVCGDGMFQPTLQSVPAELKGAVICLGNTDKQTLTEYYAMADVGILPSLHEQCSYVALEMMRAGLPLLASSAPGICELVIDDVCHQYPIGFTEAGIEPMHEVAAYTLFLLLTDSVYRQVFVRNQTEKFQAEFNASRMTAQTVGVYESLLQKSEISEEETILNCPADLISVIMPCFNAEATVAQTIDSIFAQQGVNLEVIAVDDGSSDSTLQILESYAADPRLRIIRHHENQGIVSSLNDAIFEANGEYIARIDADDLMLPGRLAKQLHFLCTHPDYDVVGSNVTLIDQHGFEMKQFCYPETASEIRMAAFFHNPICHPSAMIRASVFNKLAYRIDYRHAEDYCLWAEILNHGTKCHNLQEPLTAYRLSPTSISYLHTAEQNESAVSVALSMFENNKLKLTNSEQNLITAIRVGAPRLYWETHEKELQHIILKAASKSGIVPDKHQLTLLTECIKRQLL